MSSRIGPMLIIPAVGLAAALAIYGVERDHEGAAAASPWSPASNAAPLVPNEGALPPDHPAIGGGAMMENSPHGTTMGAAPPASDDPPAITWKVPATWQEAANPNAMRLATYHAPGGVEVSVSRAGGQTDANIQRWVSQFDDAAPATRVEKTVHGLHVVTIAVAGTYVGGGMNMGGPAEPKPDWTLVGAIVETPGSPYFFKMTGPTAAVRAARAVFDRVVDGILPA